MMGKPKNFDGVHEMGGGRFVTNATNVLLESNCDGRVSDCVGTAKRVDMCVWIHDFLLYKGPVLWPSNRQVFSIRNLHTIIIFKGTTDVRTVPEALIDF